ncbi:MAG: helix-turn-helix transcriptional regulator [Candidatus Limivivens sp.]|nr:helix-turn-helix transcriptional regulator [Candidatus Limivivens sp.]
MPYQIEKRDRSISTETISGLGDLPHLHTHLEMVYLTEGASIATVDYQEFLIEEGDLFLAFPNQIHFYHDCCPLRGYLFIFQCDLFKELKEIFQNQIPASPVLKKEQLPPEIGIALEMIMQKNRENSQFGKIISKGCLLALLGEILSSMTLVPKSSSYDSIKNILAYCSENYTEPLSLEILAKELHLNKYYISHMFQERMNISFTDFINGLRVEHACSLLEDDVHITEAAFASGFSSIRTFNRAFAKKTGMSPRDYKKR